MGDADGTAKGEKMYEDMGIVMCARRRSVSAGHYGVWYRELTRFYGDARERSHPGLSNGTRAGRDGHRARRVDHGLRRVALGSRGYDECEEDIERTKSRTEWYRHSRYKLLRQRGKIHDVEDCSPRAPLYPTVALGVAADDVHNETARPEGEWVFRDFSLTRDYATSS